MDLFLDSADLAEIRAFVDLGIISGLTTNPTLLSKSTGDLKDMFSEMCALIPGPVSLEVTATDYKTMVSEGLALSAFGDNVAIKVPLTPDGLKACRTFADEGLMVNVTLCFSAAQALLAGVAGATFVSPFIGRLDDIGQDGTALIAEIRQVYDQGGFETSILAASIRTPKHVVDAAKFGADAATIPGKVLRQLYHHPLTDRGLSDFLTDWADSGRLLPNAQ